MAEKNKVGCGTQLVVALLGFFFLCLIFPGFALVAGWVVGIGLVFGLACVVIISLFHNFVTGGPK